MRRRPWGYFDTSAVVKRYVREEGSPLAARALRQLRPLSSALMAIEALAAFRWRHQAGDLSDPAFQAILRRFAADRARWAWAEVDEPVLAQAETLVRTHEVRTLDAIHLASLLVFRDETHARVPLVTADVVQHAVAVSLGIETRWVGRSAARGGG